MNGVAPVPTAEMAVDERAALSAAACMCPAPPSRRLGSQHPESPGSPGRFTQLLHVDVQQRAGALVLVAADRLAGAPVDVGEPVQPAAA
jgi:hypothetical protein